MQWILLPWDIQKLADQAYERLKPNPRHPSLQCKKVGRFWAARVGLHYRALVVKTADGFVWFWAGTHAEYNNLIG